MNIETKFFGEIEIKDDSIITFQEGLLGLEEYKRFVLIDLNGDETFKCLQSVDEKYIAFIVLNPWNVFPDYKIDIDDDIIKQLGDMAVNDLLTLNLVTISESGMTANLIGPIVINSKTLLGKQVVLYKSSYTTKHMIKEFVKKV